MPSSMSGRNTGSSEAQEVSTLLGGAYLKNYPTLTYTHSMTILNEERHKNKHSKLSLQAEAADRNMCIFGKRSDGD